MMLSRFSWWLVLKFIKMTLEGKYQRKIESKKNNVILNLVSTFLVERRLCSWGSPSGCSWISFFWNLYINTKRRFTEKWWWLIYKWLRYLTYKNFIKDKMTGMGDILYILYILYRFKLMSQDPKKHSYWTFQSNLP